MSSGPKPYRPAQSIDAQKRGRHESIVSFAIGPLAQTTGRSRPLCCGALWTITTAASRKSEPRSRTREYAALIVPAPLQREIKGLNSAVYFALFDLQQR